MAKRDAAEDRLAAFQELNTLLPSDPKITLFGIYSSKLRASVYTETQTRMSAAMAFMMAKPGKQLSVPR